MTLVYTWMGHRIVVSTMYDVNSDETDDPHEATAFVAELPNGQWLAGVCEPDDIKEERLQ